MLGGAALLARADAALLDAGRPEDVLGRLEHLLARDGLAVAVVAGARHAEADAVAAARERPVAPHLGSRVSLVLLRAAIECPDALPFWSGTRDTLEAVCQPGVYHVVEMMVSSHQTRLWGPPMAVAAPLEQRQPLGMAPAAQETCSAFDAPQLAFLLCQCSRRTGCMMGVSARGQTGDECRDGGRLIFGGWEPSRPRGAGKVQPHTLAATAT